MITDLFSGLLRDQKLFLQKLHDETGGSGNLGNISLRSKLKWGKKRYLETRDQLLLGGFIARGKGQGGSVSLVPGFDASEIAPRESMLYTPLVESLPDWILGHYEEHSFCGFSTTKDTSAQGGRKVGGSWKRADLATIAIRAYKYVPQICVDTWSFEVKSVENLDIAAIYEAAENSEGATYAFLIVDESHLKARATVGALSYRIEAAAAKLGVGIISIVDPGNSETFNCSLDAIRRPFDPSAAQSFIYRTFSEATREKLALAIENTEGPAFRRNNPPSTSSDE
jgi:hypothetical protein